MPAAKKANLSPSAKFEARIELPGSFRKRPTGKNQGNATFNEVIEVTVEIS